MNLLAHDSRLLGFVGQDENKEDGANTLFDLPLGPFTRLGKSQAFGEHLCFTQFTGSLIILENSVTSCEYC
jgi:hypothetical protein